MTALTYPESFQIPIESLESSIRSYTSRPKRTVTDAGNISENKQVNKWINKTTTTIKNQWINHIKIEKKKIGSYQVHKIENSTRN